MSIGRLTAIIGVIPVASIVCLLTIASSSPEFLDSTSPCDVDGCTFAKGVAGNRLYCKIEKVEDEDVLLSLNRCPIATTLVIEWLFPTTQFKAEAENMPDIVLPKMELQSLELVRLPSRQLIDLTQVVPFKLNDQNDGLTLVIRDPDQGQLTPVKYPESMKALEIHTTDNIRLKLQKYAFQDLKYPRFVRFVGPGVQEMPLDAIQYWTERLPFSPPDIHRLSFEFDSTAITCIPDSFYTMKSRFKFHANIDGCPIKDGIMKRCMKCPANEVNEVTFGYGPICIPCPPGHVPDKTQTNCKPTFWNSVRRLFAPEPDSTSLARPISFLSDSHNQVEGHCTTTAVSESITTSPFETVMISSNKTEIVSSNLYPPNETNTSGEISLANGSKETDPVLGFDFEDDTLSESASDKLVIVQSNRNILLEQSLHSESASLSDDIESIQTVQNSDFFPAEQCAEFHQADLLPVSTPCHQSSVSNQIGDFSTTVGSENCNHSPIDSSSIISLSDKRTVDPTGCASLIIAPVSTLLGTAPIEETGAPNTSPEQCSVLTDISLELDLSSERNQSNGDTISSHIFETEYSLDSDGEQSPHSFTESTSIETFGMSESGRDLLLEQQRPISASSRERFHYSADSLDLQHQDVSSSHNSPPWQLGADYFGAVCLSGSTPPTTSLDLVNASDEPFYDSLATIPMLNDAAVSQDTPYSLISPEHCSTCKLGSTNGSRISNATSDWVDADNDAQNDTNFQEVTNDKIKVSIMKSRQRRNRAVSDDDSMVVSDYAVGIPPHSKAEAACSIEKASLDGSPPIIGLSYNTAQSASDSDSSHLIPNPDDSSHTTLIFALIIAGIVSCIMLISTSVALHYYKRAMISRSDIAQGWISAQDQDSIDTGLPLSGDSLGMSHQDNQIGVPV